MYFIGTGHSDTVAPDLFNPHPIKQQRGCLVAVVGYMKLSNLTIFRGLRSHMFRANGVPQPTPAPYSGDLPHLLQTDLELQRVERQMMYVLEGVEVAEFVSA
jgi:hypothetical protein